MDIGMVLRLTCVVLFVNSNIGSADAQWFPGFGGQFSRTPTASPFGRSAFGMPGMDMGFDMADMFTLMALSRFNQQQQQPPAPTNQQQNMAAQSPAVESQPPAEAEGPLTGPTSAQAPTQSAPMGMGPFVPGMLGMTSQPSLETQMERMLLQQLLNPQPSSTQTGSGSPGSMTSGPRGLGSQLAQLFRTSAALQLI